MRDLAPTDYRRRGPGEDAVIEPRRQPDRPVRIDIDRVAADPGASPSRAELRTALVRALGPTLVGRLGAEGIERAAATLERGIAGATGPGGRSRDVEVRDGD